MLQEVNLKYQPLFTTNKRYVIIMGGRGAGRSTVASQFVNAKLTSPDYFRCAIMRYILGDIRNSIYREIIDRATETSILPALNVNDSMMHIEYGRNMINAHGFKKSSGEQKAKLKSLANYNTVVIEESEEIDEEDFIQLDDSLRTVKGDITIVLLLNPPPKNHWIIKRFFNLIESGVPDFYIPVLKPELSNVEFIQTNFEDNLANLSIDTIERYRAYEKSKPAHYWNMIKGYIPETVRGKIYTNWAEIEKVPIEAKFLGRGLDFGYTNDPTALIDVYSWNGCLIVDEVAYAKGMLNSEIANTIKIQTEKGIVIADSSEPKSIDEIKGYGINIQGAIKGPGSVNAGINAVKEQKILYTKRSINIKNEQESYAWNINKDTGESTNEPIDANNHAMDAIRYFVSAIKPVEEKKDDYQEPEEKPLFSDIGL